MEQLTLDFDTLSDEELEACRQAHEELMELAFAHGPAEGPIERRKEVFDPNPKKITFENLLKVYRSLSDDDVNALLQVASNEVRDRYFD